MFNSTIETSLRYTAGVHFIITLTLVVCPQFVLPRDSVSVLIYKASECPKKWLQRSLAFASSTFEHHEDSRWTVVVVNSFNLDIRTNRIGC